MLEDGLAKERGDGRESMQSSTATRLTPPAYSALEAELKYVVERGGLEPQ